MPDNWRPRSVAFVLASTVVGAAMAFIISQSLPATYIARAQLLAGQGLDSPAPDYEQLLAAPLVAQLYAQLATGRPLIDTALQNLGMAADAQELSERVRAETSGGSGLITIEVSDADPNRASDIANQIAAELTSLAPGPDPDAVERISAVERDLAAIGREIERIEDAAATLAAQPPASAEDSQSLELLLERAADLRLQRASLALELSAEAIGPQIQIVSPSIPPAASSAPRPLLNAALAGGVTCMLSILLLFLPAWLKRPPTSVIVTEPLSAGRSHAPTSSAVQRQITDR